MLNRYRGTTTWDVWSSLGGTLMGFGGLGKSMTSPAMLFTMGCTGGDREARLPSLGDSAPYQPRPAPHHTPSCGQALAGTHVDIQLYVLVRDKRQRGQSKFHGPKSPNGHQACKGRGGGRQMP